MADRQAVITSSREAVCAFVGAARAVPSGKWTTPRAPGKWSPAQVAEHVTFSYEQSLRMLRGTYVGPAAVPRLSQLLARWLFLPWLFRRERFGKGLQAPDFIRPSDSPPPSGTLLTRLETAAQDLETDLAAASRNRGPTVAHPVFGHIPLAHLLHFLAIHTNHHRPQLSTTV
jgi:DinB family protein